MASPNDILTTKVTNGRRIGVRIRHRDLRRNALDIQFKVQTPGGGNNWIAYAPFRGRGAIVYHSGANPQVRGCPGLRVSRSLAKNWSALSVPRSCVGSPSGRIRLRVRVQWNRSGSLGDYSANGNNNYTGWVRR